MTDMSAASKKAEPYAPVASTIKPVMTGATIPEMLPKQFCSPIHFAVADGPARVWPIANRLKPPSPWPMDDNSSPPTATSGSRKAHISMQMVETRQAASMQVLRTTFGLGPLAISRSAAPSAFIGMLSGGNFGKLLVKVGIG